MPTSPGHPQCDGLVERFKETPFFLLYGKDAKLPTALDFYSPRPKTPVMYSDYGKTLFQELKTIHDVTRTDIQKAQVAQKKQYDKACHPVSINIGDAVLIKAQN